MMQEIRSEVLYIYQSDLGVNTKYNSTASNLWCKNTTCRILASTIIDVYILICKVESPCGARQNGATGIPQYTVHHSTIVVG